MGHVAVVRALGALGVNLNAGGAGETPAQVASANGHEAVVRAIEGIRRVSYYSDS